MRQVEIDQFAHAQSAAVESFHNGKIALPLGRAKVDTRLHCVDLVDGQHFGQMTPQSRTLKQQSRIFVNITFKLQITEK